MEAGEFRRQDARLLLLATYSTVIGVATEVEVLRALGIEPSARSLVRRRAELLAFLRSALLPDGGPGRLAAAVPGGRAAGWVAGVVGPACSGSPCPVPADRLAVSVATGTSTTAGAVGPAPLSGRSVWPWVACSAGWPGPGAVPAFFSPAAPPAAARFAV